MHLAGRDLVRAAGSEQPDPECLGCWEPPVFGSVLLSWDAPGSAGQPVDPEDPAGPDPARLRSTEQALTHQPAHKHSLTQSY